MMETIEMTMAPASTARAKAKIVLEKRARWQGLRIFFYPPNQLGL
jgi:hypothetical protein